VRARLILVSLDMPKRGGPLMHPDIECSLFRPPHYFVQLCTGKLTEGVVCKSTNSRPKVLLRKRVTLLYCIALFVKSE
jgi:hypothetical protein